jgi:RNA polymerase sigma-70 factor (ECF subfamily)
MAGGIRRGDERAFDAFYAAYFERLYRLLLVLGRGHEDVVRDALQETLVRVLKHIRPLPDERALWRWLTRVARTALIDQGRRGGAARRTQVPLDPLVEDLARPDDDAHEQALLDSLAHALDRLPADERALIEGHYLDGAPQHVLALDHDTTRKAIECRLARIRRKLRDLLLEDLARGEVRDE